MVSLWGSKKPANGTDGEQRDHGTDDRAANSSNRHSQEADERTRLLPPQDREGYLDPDDPAVSVRLHGDAPF
jgi:hypothetical protein